MKYVELYKLNKRVTATCHLSEENVVLCEGDEVLIGNLRDQGIKNYEEPDGQKLFFTDGIKFLEQLKFNFTSGYLNASEVKDKNAG